MTPQGHPPSFPPKRATALLVALAALLCSAEPTEPQSSSISLRLRIEWGGRQPVPWQGLLEISDGRLLDPVALGLEADEPGSLVEEESRQHISFGRPTPRTYDGIEVTVEAPRDAQLTLSLSGADGAHEPIRVPLNSLLGSDFNAPLGNGTDRVVIRRAPGDVLRVRLDQDSLVFQPGEFLSATVTLNVLASTQGGADLEPMPTDLFWTLVPARQSSVVVLKQHLSGLEQSGAATVPLKIPVPRNEGVYNLRLELRGRRMSPAERTIQLVVIGRERPEPPESPEPGILDRVLQFGKPAEQAWQLSGLEPDRLALVEVDSFSAANPGARPMLSSGGQQEVDLPLGIFLETGPDGWPGFPRGDNGTAVSWVAFGLKVKHPGAPHLLEVQYPDTDVQTLGISIIQPNEAGQVTPVGLDSGVYTGESGPGSGSVQSHRLLFWPQTKAPVVLLTNRRGGTRARVGKIALNEIRGDFSRALRPQTDPSDREPAPLRLVGSFYQKPLLPENFGASVAVDPSTGRTLDDWMTFYESGTRLIDYLHYTGGNSLMLTVLADGGTLYPSALVEPTPRWDTGVFLSTGQDPVRKDVLELLFRMFDREGLKLIPVLEFSSPLPELERVLSSHGEDAAGIELIGRDGRAWREHFGAVGGAAPYYNPLNGLVQAAMSRVVREVAQRYARHPSFAGIGVTLSSKGYTQLPGMDWGYDDETVRRYVKEAASQLPADLAAADRFTQRFEQLTGPERDRWVQWRCRELGAFYRRLRDELVSARSEARLFLLGSNLLGGPSACIDGPAGGEGHQCDDDPYRAVRRGTPLEDLLRNKGVNLDVYQNEGSIVLLRPNRVASIDRLPGGSLDEDINFSPKLDRWFSSVASRGALFVHEPYECRLPDFDRQALAKRLWTQSNAWLTAQPIPSDRENLRRYAHALASLDAIAMFDGGWLLPTGQESHTRAWVRTFASLPDQPFQTVELSTQPVVIRKASAGSETIVYLVNDSPWQVEVDLGLICAPNTTARPIGLSSPVVLNSEEGGGVLRLSMPSYGLEAFALDQPEVAVARADVRIDPAGLENLKGLVRLVDIGAVTLGQRNRSPSGDPWPRFDFDGTGEEAQLPEGWQVRGAASAHLDAQVFNGGERSLQFHADQAPATLLGPPFAAPSGRLFGMEVSVRGADKPVALRLALEDPQSESAYYRFAAVEATDEWRQFLFRIEDLPAEKLQSLRVRFDLMSEGTVWIDDIQLTALPLQSDEKRQLEKTKSMIQTARDDERWGDCHRLLGSYWARFFITNGQSEPALAESDSSQQSPLQSGSTARPERR